MTISFEIEPRGPFSLAAASRFIAGWPPAEGPTDTSDGAVRLCFALDSFAGHAGVTVRNDGDAIRVEAAGDGGEDALRAQVGRILSLDHDASDLGEVLERDSVAARLHREADALRPVLFHSPYEAAAWSIISARIQHAQALRIRTELSRRLGQVLDVDGVEMAAFPLPEALAELDSFSGLPDEKVRRLRAVAEAALGGKLDPIRLREADPADALAALEEIRGIGPFYAGLILVRSTGAADVLPPGEPRLMSAIGDAYDLGGAATPDQLASITEAWRPYRTWIAVLLRASASLG
ncbi:MAG: DNA-3-methyladenine glycosylase 2 family protein [Solirubrobacterales bacterium]|nr:DNA-3-methyladenine glycosylase 2 family protein [Solirubrobacterales bacterium]